MRPRFAFVAIAACADAQTFRSRVPGDHNLFVCGNDVAAKREVTDRLCEWFGWKAGNIIDLGDITNSRGTEMFLALWVRLWGVVGHPHFNIQVVRGS
jgi:predicted dinucleotide-binding enzyme